MYMMNPLSCQHLSREEDMPVTLIYLHLDCLFELKLNSILGYLGYGNIPPVHNVA